MFQTELFVSDDLKQLNKITDVAKQQQDYNWLKVELVKWKMFDGKNLKDFYLNLKILIRKKKYPSFLFLRC